MSPGDRDWGRFPEEASQKGFHCTRLISFEDLASRQRKRRPPRREKSTWGGRRGTGAGEGPGRKLGKGRS